VAMLSPAFVDTGDMLSTLLKDELFTNNPTGIINECLTMFFAGS
jgi:hypothetical protein